MYTRAKITNICCYIEKKKIKVLLMFPLETNISHTRPHLLLLELVASHLGHRESPARPAASGARRSPPQTRPLAPPQWTEASWSTLDIFRGYRGTSDWIKVKVSCGCRLICGVRSQTTRAAMQKIGLRSLRVWWIWAARFLKMNDDGCFDLELQMCGRLRRNCFYFVISKDLLGRFYLLKGHKRCDL